MLTAYNDEQSIGDAATDFLSPSRTQRVIVIDNSSADRTVDVARSAGAEVVIERRPGYGRCVFRALGEGVQKADTDLTLLCEGDMTLRAFDIDKFMSQYPSRRYREWDADRRAAPGLLPGHFPWCAVTTVD